jgi:hypothetical protein
MTVTTAPTTTGVPLPWRKHLRICLAVLADGRLLRLCALVFPLVLLLGEDDPSVFHRVLGVALMVTLPTRVSDRALLPDEQLRVFGLGAGERRRHIIVGEALCLVLSLAAVGVYALVITLVQGGRGTDFLIAAALVAVVVAADTLTRLRPSSRPGVAAQARADLRKRQAGRRADAAAPGGHLLVLRHTVRRTWWPLAGLLVVAGPLGFVAARVLPGHWPQTVVLACCIVATLIALTGGIDLAGALTTWLVFGGVRSVWVGTVLRNALVAPAAGLVGAGLVGAGTAVWGTGDMNVPDVPHILCVGLGTGTLVAAFTVTVALMVQLLTGWVQGFAVPVGTVVVALLGSWVWQVSAAGVVVTVAFAVVAVPLVGRLSARAGIGETGGGLRGWLGMNGRNTL